MIAEHIGGWVQLESDRHRDSELNVSRVCLLFFNKKHLQFVNLLTRRKKNTCRGISDLVTWLLVLIIYSLLISWRMRNLDIDDYESQQNI